MADESVIDPKIEEIDDDAPGATHTLVEGWGLGAFIGEGDGRRKEKQKGMALNAPPPHFFAGSADGGRLGGWVGALHTL